MSDEHKSMEDGCEIQAEEDWVDRVTREFTPHAKSCQCSVCLQAIIDRQAKQLKAKDKVLATLRDYLRDEVIGVRKDFMLDLVKQALKG